MSPEEVAAKRRVLVSALTKCLEHSRVKDVVPLESIRSILESASGELWREGEFRLEMVWKVLCQQPGLSPQEVAPPLLAFKSFEGDLEVNVRLPPALSALPPAEQAKLRDQVPLTKESFSTELQDIHAVARAQVAEEAAPRVDVGQAAQAAAAAEPARPARKPATRGQKVAAGLIACIAVAGGGVSTYRSLRDTAQGTDLSDVAPILQLSDGKQVNQSLSARINDGRWGTLAKDEQRKIAAQLFDREREKGIKVLTLVDGDGRVRVSASNVTGQTFIMVH
jgi:hypothetical protein